MELKREIAQKLPHFSGKLIIISGPRQVGKTYVVNEVFAPDLTLNMDIASDRMRFKAMPTSLENWLAAQPASSRKPVVFIDEIQKVQGWRNLIKGTFDKHSHAVQFVASGSSAFKLRQQDKGDSLAGRAIWLEMTPVTFREYLTTVAPDIELPPPWEPGKALIENCQKLLPYKADIRTHWNNYARFGGFPENLVRQDSIFTKQWLTDYIQAILDRDLKDLNATRDVDRVHQVYQLLMEGLGSTYSLRSIAGTLHAAPDTIKKDIRAIQQVLWGFDLPVAAVARAKQIRKEKKFYPVDPCFLDYFPAQADGARLECTLACALKRAAPTYTMGFFRDYQQREVDFVIREKKQIFSAIECKSSGAANHLAAFSRQFKPCEAILVVDSPGIFEKQNDYFMVSVELVAVM